MSKAVKIVMSQEERAEKIRRKNYEARLVELRQSYDKNSQRYTVRLPQYLTQEMKDLRSQGVSFSPSRLISLLLNFVLFGPHPFVNPVDAAEDLIHIYETQKFKKLDHEKEIYKEMIQQLKTSAAAKGINLDE
jgi:hypothetical protein